MEDGGQYYDERIYPMVEIEVERGDFVLKTNLINEKT